MVAYLIRGMLRPKLMTDVLVTHLIFLNDVMGRAKLGRASLLFRVTSLRLIFWG